MHHRLQLCCLLPPSLHSFCVYRAQPDSRRCPEPWRGSVLSGSAIPMLCGLLKLWDHLGAVCPQAHPPCPGWPSLAGLSGFGCSQPCSDPAPGSAGCVTVGGVGGRMASGVPRASIWVPTPERPQWGPQMRMWRPGWFSVT